MSANNIRNNFEIGAFTSAYNVETSHPDQSGEATAINIESDITSAQQQASESGMTSINIESGNSVNAVGTGTELNGSESVDASGRTIQRNIFSLFNERPMSSRGTQHDLYRPASSTAAHFPRALNPRYVRSWRMNWNNMLSFSSSPSTEAALRSLITHSGGFRYAPLSTSDNSDNIHLLLNHDHPIQEGPPARAASNLRINGRQNSVPDPSSSIAVVTERSPVASNISLNSVNRPVDETADTAANNNAINGSEGSRPTNSEEDSSVISDVFVKVLSHFVRYFPFICILFVKFIHDHLLGIFDLLLLQGIMYQINKSLREQVAKLSQKNYGSLLRDFSLVLCIVGYRFVLSATYPDPFGLLIAPPTEKVVIEIAPVATPSPSVRASEVTNSYWSQTSTKPQLQATPLPSNTDTDTVRNTVAVTKAISLGLLLYYVAVNDLILKLITQLVKISITMMPTKVIRHKSRARMYVLVEYISQFYRALAPIHQWLLFFFESYTGLEVISGVLFSSLYMGAKGFEFVERGRSVQKALINFIQNADYERKPTKDELDTAGTVCPICHDTYSTPVVLGCGHIFCDDCVNTWFKREQTCPMCRAKVSEDPTWQDGSTTFFYQLC